jgi:hypothetical protein
MTSPQNIDENIPKATETLLENTKSALQSLFLEKAFKQFSLHSTSLICDLIYGIIHLMTSTKTPDC